MTTFDLRHQLTQLRDLISADAEKAKVLYCLDHIQCRFNSNSNSQRAKIQKLKDQNIKTRLKLKESNRENKNLAETLKLTQFQLYCQSSKRQNLKKQLEKIGQKQSQKIRKESKAQQKLNRQYPLIWQKTDEKQEAGITQDGETTKEYLDNFSDSQQEKKPNQWSRTMSDSCYDANPEADDQFSKCSFECGDNLSQSKKESKNCSLGMPQCILSSNKWLLTKSSRQYKILKSQ